MADVTYDAVVLGANPSGLIAAALLARRRLRVLVVEDEPKRPAAARAGGVFRRIPFLFGCGAHQALDEVFTDIGVPLIAKKSIRALPFAYQVILPGARIDLHADDEMLAEELHREFPGHVESLRGFYAELDRIENGLRHLFAVRGCMPPQGLRERWAYRRSLRREHPDIAFYQDRRITDLARDYGFDPRVGTFLRTQIAALGHQTGDSISAWEAAVTLTLFRGGSHTCYGGEEMVLQIIRNRITALHGAFLQAEDGAPLTGRLVARGRKVEEIAFGNGERVKIGAVISSLPPERLARWIPDSLWSRRYLGRLQASRPRRVDLCFHFAMDAEAVPVGMADQVIFVADAEAPLEDGNLLRFHLSPEEEAQSSPVREREMAVSLLADPERLRGEPDYEKALLESVHRHIESFMHFAQGRYELIETRPSREELATPGAEDMFRYDVASEESMTPLPAALPPFTNLAVAGRGVLPALGLLGEILTARAASERVIRRLAP